MKENQVWRDATGREFYVKMIDHNMHGSWVTYVDESGKQYNCMIDAFKERFTRVENTK